MCDFHSVLGVALSEGKYQIIHQPDNSHSKMRENMGVENLPNRVARVFEAEWNGVGELPGERHYIRNYEECPEGLRTKLRQHYESLAKLLADPKEHAERMLFGTGYFSGDKYADVRFRVLVHADCPKSVANKLAVLPLRANGERIKSLHPKVSNLDGGFQIEAGYQLTAPALASAGYVSLDQGASLTAPVLAEVKGYVRLYQGASLTAPALAEVKGDVWLYQGASLTAPALASAGYVSLGKNAKLDAPKLKKSKAAN